jgi:hypothetical protein
MLRKDASICSQRYFIPGRSRRITVVRILSASFILVSLTVVCSGCGSSAPAERLPGKWNGKVILSHETIGNSLSPAHIAELEKMQMGIEFTKDGQMILSGANGNVPYRSQGKWQLLGQDGDVLTIKSIESDGTQKDVVIVFDGQDKFSMPLKTEVANIGAMEFERLR